MAAPTIEPNVDLSKDAAAPPRAANGLVRVCANLLPEEIIAGRRLRKLQRQLAIVLAGLVVLIGLAYAFSMWQTGQANGDLASAQTQGTRLSDQQTQYDPLVQAQSQTAALQAKLQTIMADDLSWSGLIASVNKAAAGQVTVTAVNGQVQDAAGTSIGAGAAGGPNPLNVSGLPVVGQVILSGDAPNYASVAAFVQRLGAVKGFTVVDPANLAAGQQGGLTYTVNVSLTTDILGGRFTPKTASATGATSPATASNSAPKTTGGK